MGDAEDDDRTRIAGTPEPEREAPRPVPRPGSGAAQTLPLGTRINNNYEITAVLKAGGMGEVYRGENVFTHDPVAIKLVRPDLANDEKVAHMFRREARTLGQLVDDAIVRYYNFVLDPEIDRYCLIMEFVEGTPLSDRIEDDGPLSEAEARGLMRRVAAGLAKAHAMDVVHRDLSPDNVMLPAGSIAGAKLIDFGIARSPLVAEGTMAGEFAGKFKYVSPEQLGHFDGRIGPATDIYGLGLLIAAAVRGSALPMGSSIVEAVQARREVPDLSGVPEGLRPVLAQMLEPDPADRPENMAAVLMLLDDPVPARGTVTNTGAAKTGAARKPFVPPDLSRPATTTGLRLPPGAGALQQRTAASMTAPAATVRLAEETLGRGSGGKVLAALVALFVAILGGVGWYGWQEGLIGPRAATLLPGDPGDPPAVSATPEGGTGPVSRGAFLAEFGGADCAVAVRRGSGAMAGLIEAFGVAQDWSALPDAFEGAYGSRPDVVAREVTQMQCPALAFARPFLADDGATPLDLALDAETVESGAALTGRAIDPLARPVWLALITPEGGVFNITDRLSEAVEDRRALRVGLELPTGAASAGQLLLAVAAPRPLASASAAAPGTPAADLLPLIAAELERRGGDAAVSLAYVTLQPENVGD